MLACGMDTHGHMFPIPLSHHYAVNRERTTIPLLRDYAVHAQDADACCCMPSISGNGEVVDPLKNRNASKQTHPHL